MSMPEAPPWLLEAERRLGQHEIAGAQDNSFIIECLRRVGVSGEALHDETAWCAAFVNRILDDVGIRGTRQAAALSFTQRPELFTKLAGFRFGCITVFNRIDPKQPDVPHGHVAFGVAALAKNVVVLGGNQLNAVSVAVRPKVAVGAGLIGHYWPAGVP